MCQLLETIRYSEGIFHQLEYHQARIDRTFGTLFPNDPPPNLAKTLIAPKLSGVHKCRFLYDKSNAEYHLEPYSVRPIQALRCVVADELEYRFKYLNREEINALSDGITITEEIIIIRSGLITDSSYANLAFFDGQEWYTPSNCLLQGTKRQFLIDQGRLKERAIRIEHIRNYQKVSLINAMLELDQVTVPTDRILMISKS